LNERQITALLKVTCQRPKEREEDILQVWLRPCRNLELAWTFLVHVSALPKWWVTHPLLLWLVLWLYEAYLVWSLKDQKLWFLVEWVADSSPQCIPSGSICTGIWDSHQCPASTGGGSCFASSSGMF
jgi:hypothetical protein